MWEEGELGPYHVTQPHQPDPPFATVAQALLGNPAWRVEIVVTAAQK